MEDMAGRSCCSRGRDMPGQVRAVLSIEQTARQKGTGLAVDLSPPEVLGSVKMCKKLMLTQVAQQQVEKYVLDAASDVQIVTRKQD